MRKRHDPFLKLLYKAGARDAIRLFFPDVAAHIDWEALRWIDKEVPILRGKQQPRSLTADLVGVTRDLDGGDLEVLLHPELQMRRPADMGWRVLQYNAGLTLQQANANARVLTFVIYPCRGIGGIREQRHALEVHGHSILEVGYWSVGLGDLDAAEYSERDNPIAWALASWMQQERRGRPELRLRIQDKIIRLVRDEGYRRLLWDTVRTYFTLSASEQEEEDALLESGKYGEVKTMAETWLGKMEEAAEERGRQEGRQEALRQALVEVLRSRFPLSPESIEMDLRRVQDPAALQRLLSRAATAATLDEFRKSLPN